MLFCAYLNLGAVDTVSGSTITFTVELTERLLYAAGAALFH